MRPVLRLCSVCALATCATRPLQATQTPATPAQLRGVVSDLSTGAPLSGAEILDIGTSRSATTDRDGRFELTLIEAGTTTLEIIRTGFEPVMLQVDVTPGQTVVIPAALLVLEPVSSGFQQRKAEGRGVFLDRKAVDEWQANRISDVLRHVSGVKIRPTTNGGLAITMRHHRTECSPIAFLDGAYLGSIDRFDLDASILPHTVEAIEIYRGLSEIPQRFDALGAQCGVLAFWTR